MMLKNMFMLSAIFMVIFISNHTRADHVHDLEQFSEEPNDRKVLTRAVLQKLVVWKNPQTNKPTYIYHCRIAPYGCKKRVETLVNYIYTVSKKYNVDPWLMSSVAWYESRFNPFAESHAGAVGLFQILKKARWSKGIKFIHNWRYRRKCRKILGACQMPIVDTAVELLKSTIKNCGSVRSGLGQYNTGRCNGNPRYSRRVLWTKQDLLKRAKTIRETSFKPISVNDKIIHEKQHKYCIDWQWVKRKNLTVDSCSNCLN